MENGTTSTELALRGPAAISPYEPRSYEQALAMAETFSAASSKDLKITPQQAYLKMATGAELGIPATTALRMIDCADYGRGNQVTLRAQLMVALCLRQTNLIEYFRFVEGDAKSATYIAKRRGEPEQRETYTIEQAKQAGLVKDGGAWTKDPASQLIARASSRLARRVAPDILGGFYTPDEAREIAASEPARDVTPAPVTPLRAAAASAAEPIDAEVVESKPAESDEKRIVRLLGEATTQPAAKLVFDEAMKIWPKERPAAVKDAWKAAKARIAEAATAALVKPAEDKPAPAVDPVTNEREPGSDDE